MKPLPPWHSSASTTTGATRLQIQYFAIGAPMRASSRSDALALAVERRHDPEGEPGRRLGLEVRGRRARSS